MSTPSMSSAPATAQRHEIRVLAGPQRGASVPVAEQRPLMVSDLWDGDIVLRNSQGLPLGFTLVLEGQGARLRVLRGQVRVGERELGEGDEALVALCEPIQVGDAALALGPVGDARWDPGAASAAGPAGATAPQAPSGAVLPRRWISAMLWGGGVLCAVSAVLSAVAWTAAPRSESLESRTQRGQALLQANGWRDARLQDNGYGALALLGQFDSSAQRQEAVAKLAAAGLNVELSAAAARPLDERVRDVLRANGVSAEVAMLDAGRVRVALSTDAATSRRVEAAVRTDVAGLVGLEWLNAAPKPPVAPTVDDPGKRVAALVPGDPAYVVTADGARYFLGAMLPTGHLVRHIEGREVTLEREGEITHLKF